MRKRAWWFLLASVGCGESDTDRVVGDTDEPVDTDVTDDTDVAYACGWGHDDPGDLVSTGSEEGDVIDNVPLVDQCGETVPLWDFAREYHILFLTASW